MQFSPSSVAHAAVHQMYAAMSGILEKAEAHAKASGVEEAVYLGWRLAPDMFTMARQVQIACDISSRGLARLAGAEPPSMPDTEKSFAELRARVAKAHEFIKGLDAKAIDANPDADITIPMRTEQMTMKRHEFLMGFVLPNLYFHTTTAYAILRGCSVPVGKADFLARK